jgi:dipeptidyl aminopeptidase/acylaminoacyl peptidase
MRNLVALALGATFLAGCTLPPPPGDAPLRYRDAVFSNVAVSSDITYRTAPDLDGNPVTLKLDVYQPTGDTVSKRPALVWVHGGGFTTGDKSSGRSRATFFARLGYVAVSINYRLLSPDGCGGNPDPTPVCEQAALAARDDALAAIQWLRDNAATYRIDTSRIAIAGASAGAVTSLLVDWTGPSSGARAAVSVSGGAPTNELITADDGPAMFIHGTEDQVVPYEWAVQNAAAMYNLGILTVFEALEGAGHGLGGTYGTLINEQSDYFLYTALDLAHAER